MIALNVMSCELKKNISSSGSQDNQLKFQGNSSYFGTSNLCSLGKLEFWCP